MRFPHSRFIVITGTDTDVGKTVTTAALAVALEERGFKVAIVKPVQTGVQDGDRGDIDEVVRLTGNLDVHEFVRLQKPLAPESAAMLELVELPTVAELAARIRKVEADAVLIEGAGGLLVRVDLEGGTMRDLAKTLRAEVVVVGREGLGTLNHFQLTVDNLRTVLTHEPHVVIGSYAHDPGLAEQSNRVDLPRITGLPIDGRIPERAGRLSRKQFREQAPTWFTFRWQ